jgi:hypothetical protein
MIRQPANKASAGSQRGQTHGQTDRQTDIQTDRQTERQPVYNADGAGRQLAGENFVGWCQRIAPTSQACVAVVHCSSSAAVGVERHRRRGALRSSEKRAQHQQRCHDASHAAQQQLAAPAAVDVPVTPTARRFRLTSQVVAEQRVACQRPKPLAVTNTTLPIRASVHSKKGSCAPTGRMRSEQ